MSGPTRQRLPNRRLNVGGRTKWIDPASGGEHKIHVQAGFFPDGADGEVFAVMAKRGTVMRAMAEQASVMISIIAQYGMSFAELGQRIGCQAGGEQSSPISAIIAEAAGIGAEWRAGIVAEGGKKSEQGPLERGQKAVVFYQDSAEAIADTGSEP